VGIACVDNDFVTFDIKEVGVSSSVIFYENHVLISGHLKQRKPSFIEKIPLYYTGKIAEN